MNDNEINRTDRWNRVYERLNQSSMKFREEFKPGKEEQKAILEKRAKELALKTDESEFAETVEVVEFRLGDEKYGIECIHVREIYPLRDLTPVPGVPAFVLGIISIRGEIVSVIDLKKFFEMPDKGLTDLTRVIILKNDEMQFGILAEEVMGTISIKLNDIQPDLPTLTGIRSEFLKGVSRNHLVVLDALKLMGDKKMIVNQEGDF